MEVYLKITGGAKKKQKEASGFFDAFTPEGQARILAPLSPSEQKETVKRLAIGHCMLAGVMALPLLFVANDIYTRVTQDRPASHIESNIQTLPVKPSLLPQTLSVGVVPNP
ncbi:MAG: hypothetical protein WCD70_05820 [Alphaproteobacteria bacterium]